MSNRPTNAWKFLQPRWNVYGGGEFDRSEIKILLVENSASQTALMSTMGVNPQKKIEGTSPLPPLPPFSPPLEVDPLNPTRGSGSAVSSPARFGQSPSRNWIWWILTLKSDIWRQQLPCALVQKCQPQKSRETQHRASPPLQEVWGMSPCPPTNLCPWCWEN